MTSDESKGSKEPGKAATTDQSDAGFAEQVVQSERRRKGRMIVGALAASGVFQLNGWQVQAHGNRSSHDAEQVARVAMGFGPEDYVLMRQQATAPNWPKTQELFQVTEQMRVLSRSDAEYKSLDEKRRQLSADMQLRRSTNKALKFIEEGDVSGAIAAVEGLGWPQRVLAEYMWVLLDVAHLSGTDGKTTSERTKEFLILAKAAKDYADRFVDKLPKDGLNAQEQAARVRAAEVYHNIASFTIPDDGVVDPDAAKLGFDAAQRALEIRKGVGSLPEIMRAHWMVGRHELRAGKVDAAVESLNKALKLAKKTDDQAGLVWSKIYLAKALSSSESKAKDSQRLLAEAEKDVMRIDDPAALKFLALEKDGIGKVRLDEASHAAEKKWSK